MPKYQLGPDELHELQAAIGAAVWHMPFLEDVLVNSLTMRLTVKRRGAVDLPTALAELAKQRKKPLGQLIRDATAGQLLDTTTAQAFEVLREERNWLVHRSIHEGDDAVYTAAGREALLVRLRALSDRAVQLKKALADDLFAWLVAQGLDVAGINAATEAEFRRLRT